MLVFTVLRSTIDNYLWVYVEKVLTSRAHHGGGANPESVASLDLTTATQEDTSKVKRATLYRYL